MWKDIQRKSNWGGEIVNKRKDGSFITQWMSISGIYDDKNRRGINTSFDMTSEADTSVGSKFVGKRREEGDPLYSEDPLGEYQLPSRKMIENKMKPTKPEKPNYRENQKIVMMKSKNLEFIPTGEQEFKPKKALPCLLYTSPSPRDS